MIKVPKTGGSLALIPILAGLSALGTLAGGVSRIRSNGGSRIQLGKGVYLNPHKSGGSYTIIRKSGAKRTGSGLKKTVTRKKKKYH